MYEKLFGRMIDYLYNYNFTLHLSFFTSHKLFTQVWNGLDIQVGIEQPIKHIFLKKDLAVLAKKSAVPLSVRGVQKIQKSLNPLFNSCIYSNYVENFGHAWGSPTTITVFAVFSK